MRETADMDATARALELLGLLQRGGGTGPELAARLGVTERTLRRDVGRLRELGYGVDATRGAVGGYRLGAGASVPPLVLHPDEAVAIAVGLRGAVNGAIGGLAEAAAGALAKLEGSLSHEARERIAAVSGSVVELAGAATVPVDTVVTVARSIRERRGLRIRYVRHDGTEVTRTIEPHRMVHTAERWYVLAYVDEQRAWRTYRLDRLEPVLPFAGRFAARDIPDDAVQRFTNRAIATAPYRVRCRVVVHASLADARARYGPDVAEARAIGPDRTELVFGADDLETAAVYLGVSGLDFSVVDPPALREAVAAVAARLAAAATRTPPG